MSFSKPTQINRSFKSSLNRRSFSTSQVEFRLYDHVKLQNWTTGVFSRLGVPQADAAQAAEVLILSDVRGVDSHGVARLSTYFDMIRANKINLNPNVKIVRETPSTARVDGDNGLGLVVAPKANQIAIKKAGEAGSGWVSIGNTNHYGMAAYYAIQALKKDLIGWSMTNSTKLVAPFNGAEPYLGTNPICVAFPGKKFPPIIVDMATSAVAYGKVEIANRKQVPIPSGWAINNEGVISTNPHEVIHKNGALLPLGSDAERGGHKGYCLAVIVDILSCVLSGANWGPFAPPFTLQRVFFEEGQKVRRVGKGIGHFFGAMRIDGFIDADEFKSQIDDYRVTMKNAKAAKGSPGVILPGDPELEHEKKRTKEGIPLVLPVVEDLRKIGQTLNYPFLD